jgi:UDP-N-acetyl-D-glucosamine dehydrogenase
MSQKKKVVVVGLGYVGLPALTTISQTGQYQAFGFDIDQNQINQIKKGHSPIADSQVAKFLKTGSLNVSSSEKVLKNTDIFIICVPTPVNNDHTPDYGPVESASKTIAKYLKKGAHFVLESTVNPGTCEEIVLPILEKGSGLRAGKDFNLAHCPERINPGDEKWTIKNINRNIGSINQKMNREIANFYRSFVSQAQVNEVTCLKVAEATKIVENTFRDINIAFVNELAQSFDTLNIDLYETLRAASNKPFAFMAHWPGCGVGGHCIAVDPYYLIRRASQNGFNHRFLKLAREINNGMPKYCVNKLAEALNKASLPVKGTRIALLGLAYKPEVNDLRESPSLKIEEILKSLEANLVVYDPFIPRGAKNLKEALKGAQAIVLATAHKEIVAKLPGLLKNNKTVKVVVDGRNALDRKMIEKNNIIYTGIGRGL